MASLITLEQRAHNTDYKKVDVKGCIANGSVCVPGANDCIISELNMNCISEEVNISGSKVKAVVSNDAGRFVWPFFGFDFFFAELMLFMFVSTFFVYYTGRVTFC